MRKSYIYKITSPEGRNYIGRTVDIKKRVIMYKNAFCKRQRLLYNSIKKYGWQNHKIEIIVEDIVSHDKLNELEIYYIEYYKTFWEDGNGMNLTRGGASNKGHKHTDEVKKLLSEKNKGRKHTEETKSKMSKSHIGKKPSPETIRKTQEGRKKNPNLPYKFTEKDRKKIAEGQYKPVIQLSLESKFIKRWEGVAVAADALKTPRNNISNCCTGKYGRMSAGGFIWVYEKDYDATKIYRKVPHSEIMKSIHAEKRGVFVKGKYLNTLK